MTGVEVSRCDRCGWTGFPARLWCPSCLGDEIGATTVEGGVVEDATTVYRATGRRLDAHVRLGTVGLDGGGTLVARLEGADVGGPVRLSTDAGAPVARPRGEEDLRG
jgi:uncharacterized OB-fold protein